MPTKSASDMSQPRRVGLLLLLASTTTAFLLLSRQSGSQAPPAVVVTGTVFDDGRASLAVGARVVLVVDPDFPPSFDLEGHIAVPTGRLREETKTDSVGRYYYVLPPELVGHSYQIWASAGFLTASVNAVTGVLGSKDSGTPQTAVVSIRAHLAAVNVHPFPVDFISKDFIFATDRTEDAKGQDHVFGTGLDSSLHYGEFSGYVPADDVACKLPGWKCAVLDTFSARDYTHYEIHPEQERSAFDRLLGRIRESKDPNVLLFVHGFNESFEQAEMDMLHLALELRWKGPAILYSWPSAGDMHAYSSDGEIADSATEQERFRSFLASLEADFPAMRLNIVAHSMGNRLLAHALVLSPDLAKEIATISYVAPDMLGNDLDVVASGLKGYKVRQRLYHSSNDLALHISACKNHSVRLGLGLPTYPAGIDSYDATNVAPSTSWGHSYFVNSLEVAKDLEASITGSSNESFLKNLGWLGKRESVALTFTEQALEGTWACQVVQLLGF